MEEGQGHTQAAGHAQTDSVEPLIQQHQGSPDSGVAVTAGLIDTSPGHNIPSNVPQQCSSILGAGAAALPQATASWLGHSRRSEITNSSVNLSLHSDFTPLTADRTGCVVHPEDDSNHGRFVCSKDNRRSMDFTPDMDTGKEQTQLKEIG